MIERLLASLRALAASPRAGEALVLEYADAWLLARQCPGLEFTDEQVELLDAIEEAPQAAIQELARGALAAITPGSAPAPD